MCGIAGFYSSYSPYEDMENTLHNMAKRMAHRGPDDEGVWFDAAAGVGLAHRRLSVIDPSMTGHQPMGSDDGRVQIVFNGEIYNFREIRKTLESLGHRFRSMTDTEVALNAYLQWGPDALQRFVGMFALAVWDSRTRHLFLARDRLGIKPIYYYLNRGLFLFASELKGIMACSSFEKETDDDSIPLFLHYQYIPAPRTIFRKTYKLLPGHFLLYDGSHLRTEAYWRHPDEKPLPDGMVDEAEALERLDDLLTQAVSDHLVSDVPLGALLSGGIDSSMITAIMQKITPAPVKTFSIGFKEASYNEAPWAAKVAGHLRTDHTEYYVTPRDAMNIIPRLPEIYDEPFADASVIPTVLVSQLTRSNVTVALSGDGGDEQFAGYARYWGTRAMANTFSRLPQALREVLARLMEKLPNRRIEDAYLRWREILPKCFRVANFPDKWRKLILMMRYARIEDIYPSIVGCPWSVICNNEQPPTVNCKRSTANCQPSTDNRQLTTAFRETKGWPLLSRLMRVDQKTYLPDDLLTKVDRASMTVGLEVRVPLLDHRIVEYTARLPESLKFRNGTGKYLLKKLLTRYMPESLFERPKMGFGVPVGSWFRGELRELLSDYLSHDRLKKEGLFDEMQIERAVKAHLSGKADHPYELWTLLMWEMWRERWIG